MLNPYTLNIQESLKHAWHSGIVLFEVLGSESVKRTLGSCVLIYHKSTSLKEM